MGQASYAGLGARLRAEAGDRLALNFAEVEQLLGRSLPWSAQGRGWWANYCGRAHARAWLEAGWRVHLVEPRARRVTFVRTGAPTDGEAAPSAYARLGAYLRTRETDRVDLSFDHFEAILGRPLPPSARTMRGWWANVRRGHVQAAAWLDAGWRVARLDRSRATVAFVRAPAPGVPGAGSRAEP